MRGLEQIPRLYDWTMALLEAVGLRKLRRRLIGGARGRVLDLGCGTGRNLPGLAGPVVGLDPHRESLPRARKRAPGALLVQAYAEALPFVDGAFDTVITGLVFCSVADPARALREVGRVLRPGGELRCLEHVRSRRPWLARLQDRMQPGWTRLCGGCHPNRATEETVAQAGWQIVSERPRADVVRLFSAHRRG